MTNNSLFPAKQLQDTEITISQLIEKLPKANVSMSVFASASDEHFGVIYLITIKENNEPLYYYITNYSQNY